MPYALCPMPYALCPVVPHMRARKAIGLYDTLPLLLESNAASRLRSPNLLVLSPMLANNTYLQSEQMWLIALSKSS